MSGQGGASQGGASQGGANQGGGNQGAGNGERTEINVGQLEVAALVRGRPHRTFRRITGARLEDLLGQAPSAAGDAPEDPGSAGSGGADGQADGSAGGDGDKPGSGK